ncbi:MAG: ATP-binding cassette domain-containing protein [Oscillospiraceae bacterium]
MRPLRCAMCPSRSKTAASSASSAAPSCGKSTLIQIMAGLLTPTAGTVMLDGQDIHARRYDRSILRRKVGIVFQYPECQLFETTVEKDVAFGLKHSGLSAAEKQARACAGRSRPWASRSKKVHDQPPMGLSGGRSGAWPSRACWRRSRSILILDEPIAGLDPLGRRRFAAHHRAQPRRHDHPSWSRTTPTVWARMPGGCSCWRMGSSCATARRRDLRRPRLDARAPAGRAAEPHRRRPAPAGRAGHSAGHRKL